MYFGIRVLSEPNFPGVVNWVQLDNRSTTFAQSTGGQYWLDNDPLYNTEGGKPGKPPANTDVDPTGTIILQDNPGVKSTAVLGVTCTDDFLTYLVFQPNP